MGIHMGRHAGGCMLIATAFLLACASSTTAQEDCEYWAGIFMGREAIEKLQACLEAGADVNAPDRFGSTPLHVAARVSDHAEVILALVNAGSDVHARRFDGGTPLHTAVESGDSPQVVEALVAAGADVNARDNTGNTPLHRFKGSSNPAVARRLIEFGTATADVVQRCIEGGADVMSAFPHEPVSGYPEPTRLYSQGATPPHVAAGWTRDREAITLLVDAGADVNALDPYGYTPLHRAARDNANPAVVSALLEAGADPNRWTAGAQRARSTSISPGASPPCTRLPPTGIRPSRPGSSRPAPT